MKFYGIIPARYASTRFPGKPLTIINGKSMIQRVYEQTLLANLDDVIVATDDDRIAENVESFKGKFIMTSPNHKSGTDRCFEVVKKMNLITDNAKDDVVINIQGDEPYINPAQIETIKNCFSNPVVNIATLIKKISDNKDIFNLNVVKVIPDVNKKAIYFSRAAIPFYRGKETENWSTLHNYYKHIGIYAYKIHTLCEISKLEQSNLEIAESLEQLRWIENGYNIHIDYTDIESIAIDVPEDLLKLK